MKKSSFVLVSLFPLFLLAQEDSIAKGVYSWKDPLKQSSKTISTVTLFQGSTNDMEWLQMSANSIAASRKKITVSIPNNEEQLLIIKSGNLTIGRDSVYSLGANSVALFMPGATYVLANTGNEPSSYYLLKYRSKNSIDIERANGAGGSLVKDWSQIEFKPHDKGGRRDFFERATAMCKRFEMHVTTLKRGLKSHDPHVHRAAEIIIVIDGSTEMLIGDKLYKGEKGSIYYLPSKVLHGIQNKGVTTCSYFAFQFE